jgi:hypothetical protein
MSSKRIRQAIEDAQHLEDVVISPRYLNKGATRKKDKKRAYNKAAYEALKSVVRNYNTLNTTLSGFF